MKPFEKKSTRLRVSEKVHDKKFPSMGYTCFRTPERVHHTILEEIIAVLETRKGSETKSGSIWNTDSVTSERDLYRRRRRRYGQMD